MSVQVKMFSTAVCPYCIMAERLLQSKGVEHIEKIRVDLDPVQRDFMMQQTGRRTVPQIYIGTRHIGGYDDLAVLEHSGELTGILTAD